jgi:hypothetical protein
LPGRPPIDTPPYMTPWYAHVRERNTVRPASPARRWVARAIFIEASIASEPPSAKWTRPSGSGPRSRMSSASSCEGRLVKRANVWYAAMSFIWAATASAISVRP